MFFIPFSYPRKGRSRRVDEQYIVYVFKVLGGGGGGRGWGGGWGGWGRE